MVKRTISADGLARLKRERESADRAYNDALTALDAAVMAHQETAQAVQAGEQPVLDALVRLVELQSKLILWAQQITPYLDTKDREVAGLARRVSEDTAVMATDARETLERTIGLVQQRELTLKREVERLLSAGPARSSESPSAEATRSDGPSGHAASLDAYKYVGFEQAFRGSAAEIRDRLAAYGPYFDGASDVLDVGCGRGEFLEVLGQRGVTAHGIDLNHEMVEACHARGLEVEEADAVAHLEGLADGSLGGLFAAQVVEHLQPAYLMRLLELAYHKLRPGSRIVLETINVACWSAFFGPYLRDLSHERPIPPETLTFLLQASGFQRVELRSSSPVDDDSKLVKLAPEAAAGPQQERLVATFNSNVDRLNQLLFTHLDYAAVGERV